MGFSCIFLKCVGYRSKDIFPELLQQSDPKLISRWWSDFLMKDFLPLVLRLAKVPRSYNIKTPAAAVPRTCKNEPEKSDVTRQLSRPKSPMTGLFSNTLFRLTIRNIKALHHWTILGDAQETDGFRYPPIMRQTIHACRPHKTIVDLYELWHINAVKFL